MPVAPPVNCRCNHEDDQAYWETEFESTAEPTPCTINSHVPAERYEEPRIPVPVLVRPAGLVVRKYLRLDRIRCHPNRFPTLRLFRPFGHHPASCCGEVGYGKPATRRLPYNDFGIVLAHGVKAGPGQQTVQTASYGANRLGFDVGEFVHISVGGPDEEYVQVLAAEPENQTFDAIFTKEQPLGATVRPTIWPTPILNEGDSLAFDILAVASPDPGLDLLLVIQT